MERLIRISSQDFGGEFRLQLNSESCIAVGFGNHYEWIKLKLEEHQGKFCLSHVKSVACCEHAQKQETVDDFLDRLHCRDFGQGGWLKWERRRLPFPQGQETCVGKEQRAWLLLDEYDLGEAERELDALCNTDWGGEKPAEDSALGMGRKRKQQVKELEVEAERGHEGLAENKPLAKKRKKKNNMQAEELDAFRKLGRKVGLLKPTGPHLEQSYQELQQKVERLTGGKFLAKETQSGIDVLRRSCNGSIASTYQPFETLIEYRRTRNGDFGERLGQIFDDLAERYRQSSKEEQKASKRNFWSHSLLSESARVVQRCRDPEYSSTGDPEAERRLREKEKRPRLLNKIINRLREHIGGDAWGVYCALRERAVMASVLYQIADNQVDEFAAAAVEDLRKCDLAKIPGDAPTLHIPALLSWLLGTDFQDTCRWLCLDDFANENPNIATELDKLASEYEELNDGHRDYQTRRAWLETQASKAMTIPLSKLRTVHLDAVQPGECQCSQHTPRHDQEEDPSSLETSGNTHEMETTSGADDNPDVDQHQDSQGNQGGSFAAAFAAEEVQVQVDQFDQIRSSNATPTTQAVEEASMLAVSNNPTAGAPGGEFAVGSEISAHPEEPQSYFGYIDVENLWLDSEELIAEGLFKGFEEALLVDSST